MTIGRVTTSQITASSAASIQAAKARLSQLTAQSSSGLLVSKPSDDPAATAAILRVRGEQSATAQYATNIGDGLGWLSTADSTMTSAENLVRQAKDLSIQAASSGTMTATAREAIASQLAGIRDDLLGRANTQYNGRSVFAGTSDAGTAFDPVTFAYNGATTTTPAIGTTPAVVASAGSVTRRIGGGGSDTVTVSSDGLAAFGSGPTSVFQRIQDVIDALRDPGYDTDVVSTTTGLTPKDVVTGGIDSADRGADGPVGAACDRRCELRSDDECEDPERHDGDGPGDPAVRTAGCGHDEDPARSQDAGTRVPDGTPGDRPSDPTDLDELPIVMNALPTARDTRLSFTAPPPGFAPLTDFELEHVDGAPGLYTLRDTAGADLRLFLLDPTFYVPEYLPELSDEDLGALGASSVGEVDVYVVADIQGGVPVVNLLAPIVVNPGSGAATQLILEDDWPLQVELLESAA